MMSQIKYSHKIIFLGSATDRNKAISYDADKSLNVDFNADNGLNVNWDNHSNRNWNYGAVAR